MENRYKWNRNRGYVPHYSRGGRFSRRQDLKRTESLYSDAYRVNRCDRQPRRYDHFPHEHWLVKHSHGPYLHRNKASGARLGHSIWQEKRQLERRIHFLQRKLRRVNRQLSGRTAHSYTRRGTGYRKGL
jgi:hypothetical protein